MYLPYLGILFDRFTTSKHVYSHLSKTVSDAGCKRPSKPEKAGSSTSEE